ncbi:MAG: GDSL-like Lipase/Acylhydrolase family protein [Burkholderia sp.]|nr:GDSL-like Lipase/Acylhydrolase family protein [Burkholderia sp.]
MKNLCTHFAFMLVVALVAGLRPQVAMATKPFSQFVDFSGALSDTGNYASVGGASSPLFYQGRTTNGPVAAELLAARLGLEAKPSYHLTGRATGTNFAVRDALAGADGPHDLHAQLRAYLDPRGGKADPDAFYLIFNGGNDVIRAVLAPEERQAQQVLDNAVAGLEKALRTLVKAGAKTIMAPNFIDLSLVPAIRKANLAPRAHRLSLAYNLKFAAMLDRVERELNVQFIHWDFNGFVNDVINHGHEVGLTNRLDACDALQAAGRCDPDRFVFLTDNFPTAKVHELMAQAMALAILQRDRAVK